MNLAQTLAQGQTPISIVDLVITLGVAFIAGLWVVFIFRFTHRGVTYERSFLLTLVMCPPIVGLVMLLIGSNLALSLGLVGALSIIRFRNVIKDSRDMIYLFWTIAIGLGCGTYNWVVIAVASALIGVVLIALHFVEYGKPQDEDVICVTRGVGEGSVESVLELLGASTVRMTVRSMENQGEGWELVSELKLSANVLQGQQELLRKVRGLEGVEYDRC